MNTCLPSRYTKRKPLTLSAYLNLINRSANYSPTRLAQGEVREMLGFKFQFGLATQAVVATPAKLVYSLFWDSFSGQWKKSVIQTTLSS